MRRPVPSHPRTNSRRKQRCRILFCPRITTSGRATFIFGVCTAILPPQPSVDPPTFPICCSHPVWGRALSARSHWWRRCCTAHLAALAILHDFRSLTAARIGIPSRFPSKFTMRPFACSVPPSIEQSSAGTTRCSLCGSSMRNRGASSASRTGRHSMTSSPTNSCGHMNMAAAAFRLGAALGGSSRATQRARAKVKTPIPSSVGGGQPPMR